jgi:hypothetical protein
MTAGWCGTDRQKPFNPEMSLPAEAAGSGQIHPLVWRLAVGCACFRRSSDAPAFRVADTIVHGALNGRVISGHCRKGRSSLRTIGGAERRMNRFRVWIQRGRLALLAALVCLVLMPETASAQSRHRQSPPSGSSDEDDRPQPRQTRPLPDIVARVQSTPPYNSMDYIGVAGFETRSMIYVLRFLDGRQVVVVHVDARSGRIVGRAP